MIFVNSIANALFTTISSNSVIVSSGYTVNFGEPIPGDETFTPWANVSFPTIEALPNQTGNTPWLTRVNFDIIIQDGSLKSPLDALDRTMKSLFPVLTAVNSNKTLDGTVLTLREWSVSFESDKETEDWLHTARANLSYELYV